MDGKSALKTNWDIRIEYRVADFALRVDQTWTAGITGLVGPSGSGKTTLLELLLGIRGGHTEAKLSGVLRCNEIVLFDSQNKIDMPAGQRGLAWVPQESLLLPHLSVRENILFGCSRVERNSAEKKLAETAKLLGIGHRLDHNPDEISGGESQRCAIARAILSGRRQILLDEPMSALDPARRENLATLLQTLHAECDVSMIIVSHSPAEVERLCDYVIALSPSSPQN